MIFAAGLGTRLKPFTDHHPKALAVVNGKTLLQRNIEYLKSYGLNDIVINVHHFAQQIKDYILENEGFGCTISISDESDNVLETGGGLKYANDLLNDSSILVMNADILSNLNLDQFIAFHRSQQNDVTLAITNRVSSRALLFDANMRLCGWKNKNTGELKMPITTTNYKDFAFSGIQIVNKSFINRIELEGKFSIIEAYLQQASVSQIIGYDHSGDLLIDVGKPESITIAEQNFK
jgi:MurNAc alpha-1-phosphate uridylyltransferase